VRNIQFKIRSLCLVELDNRCLKTHDSGLILVFYIFSGQQNDEFVSADAETTALLVLKRRTNDVGTLHQHFVATTVTEIIVDIF
jgi:hypothetical protein